MTKKIITLFHTPLYDFKKNTFGIGGIQTYLRNLMPIMQDVGLESHIIFPSSTAHVDVVDGTALHAIEDRGTLEKSLIREASSLGDCKKDLFLFADSTLIAPHPFTNSLAIQHGIYWDTEAIHGYAVTGRGYSLALRAVQAKRQLDAHALVSQMICVDLNYVNWMRALSVANRLPYRYIPNFADTSNPAPQRKKDGVVRIVFARRFEAIRGCELLAEVMPGILERHPEVELTIAGSGSMEAGLRQCLGMNPRVIFTSYDASESVAFHGKFDIALVPSIASEGTSLSLLEAMAAGCAVVATDVGGMSNIVLNGHNGILVRPEAEELEQGIERLLRDSLQRGRIARNARRTVEDSFSKDRWVRSWTEVFGEYL